MYYASIQPIKLIENSKHFTTVKHLSIKDLRELMIPLPPLPEQRKIAAVLSAVQEAKEKTETVIKATKELKKSLMKHLFTYGPVPLEEAENVPLKETEIGLVPEGWEVARLDKIFRLSSGKSRPSIIKPRPEGEFVYPIYGGNGVMGFSTDYFVEAPTLVLGRVGEYCGSVHVSTQKCWISDNALYAKQFIANVNLSYLALALSILDLNRFKKKSGQPLITQNIAYSEEIPFPQLQIQQRIADILSEVDRKIEAQEDKKKALEELFKTILDNLMTGKIRVNQLEVGS